MGKHLSGTAITAIKRVTFAHLLQSPVNPHVAHSLLITITSFSWQNVACWTSGAEVAGQLKETQKKPRWRRYLRFRKRRRGTVIVDTSKGILVVSEDGKTYNLPGGAAKDGESWRDAAIRELEEETGLKADEYSYLFACTSRIHRDIKGGFFQDAHKVYVMKASGVAEPKNEVKHVAYTNDSNVNLSGTTKRIIEKYLEGRVQT